MTNIFPNSFTGVSVVIPCRNEEKYIKRCIDSIVEGTASEIPIEILVVDGMSMDNTPAIIDRISKEHNFVRRIINPAKETQIALNLGVSLASFSHVMIAGAHAEFPEGYIKTLLVQMNILHADGVGGSLKTDVLNRTKTSVAISKVLSHPVGVGNSMFRVGADHPVQVDTVPFGIYKKELFEEVGYYNEKLKRNHDMEWSKRVINSGKKIFLIPEVQCVYYARENYQALATNNFRNGLWNILAVCLTRTFRSLSIRHFVPFGFVGSLLVVLISGMFYSPLLYAGLGLLLMYLMILMFFSLKISGNGTTILHLVLAFVVLHFSYGFGSMVGVFHGIPVLFRKSS